MVTASSFREWAISHREVVYTVDGHPLGEVVRGDSHEIEVECGLFFRQRYHLSTAEIVWHEDGVVTSTLTLDEATARERR